MCNIHISKLLIVIESIAVYIRKLHKWSPVLNHTILEFAYNVTLVQAQKV